MNLGLPRLGQRAVASRSMVTAVAPAEEHVEHADADGERNERVLRRGSEAVVRTRQENARSNSRARAAVQAALDQRSIGRKAARRLFRQTRWRKSAAQRPRAAE